MSELVRVYGVFVEGSQLSTWFLTEAEALEELESYHEADKVTGESYDYDVKVSTLYLGNKVLATTKEVCSLCGSDEEFEQELDDGYEDEYGKVHLTYKGTPSCVECDCTEKVTRYDEVL